MVIIMGIMVTTNSMHMDKMEKDLRNAEWNYQVSDTTEAK